jgi:hypothetical protein
MKPKKLNCGNCHTAKKNNNAAVLAEPIPNEFELMYRAVDRMPSSEQMESVIFVKRKRILPTEQSLYEQRKSMKKMQNSKKRKTEEKYVSD